MDWMVQKSGDYQMKVNWFILIIIYLITLIIIISATYLITKSKIKPVVIEKEKVIKVFDTLKIHQVKIISKPKLVIIKDTLLLKDSIYKASLDTIINNSDTLSIDYYFPPINKFEIDLRLKEKMKMIIDTIQVVNIQVKRNYYEYVIVFLVGALIGIAL